LRSLGFDLLSVVVPSQLSDSSISPTVYPKPWIFRPDIVTRGYVVAFTINALSDKIALKHASTSATALAAARTVEGDLHYKEKRSYEIWPLHRVISLDIAVVTGTRRAQKASCASVTMVDRDSTIHERGEVEKQISLGHRKDTECTMELLWSNSPLHK
jgi:hypothetical protein